MSKSRARFLAELLNSDGRVRPNVSALAGADGVIDLEVLPTIPNSQLEHSSISIAGHTLSLGGSLSLDTSDITEHASYLYYTDARVRGTLSVSGSLSYNSTTGVISYTTPTTIASLSNHNTDDLSEGVTNLYYTDGRVGSYLTTNSYATQGYVSTAISNLVDSSPATLDTLNELAAALGDDPNFATTVSTNIGTKWTQDNTKISNWDTAYGWGNHASAGYLPSSSYTASDVLTKIKTVDGSDSGLDADTIDGIQGSVIIVDKGTTTNLDAYTQSADNGLYRWTGTQPTGSPGWGYGAALSYDDGSQQIQIAFGGTNGRISVRRNNSGTWASWNEFWSAGNDGSGSGLDADLLDGQQGSYYYSSANMPPGTSTTGAWTTHATAYGNIQLGPANNSYAHIYSSGPDFYFNKNLYVLGSTVWHSGNDGSGSGLDADLLDGIQASSFQRLDAACTIPDGVVHKYECYGNIATAAASQSSLEVFNNGAGTDAFLTFHVGGDYAAYLGVDGGINDLAYGGWSAGAVSNRVWHAGNDGAGSGLDADLLDGQQGSYYAPASHNHSGVYLPIGGKAADSELLDGIDSTSFLRSDTADTFTGTLTMGTQQALVANNYGRGVFGVYSATRYQHVWSMGTAYKTSDDGTSYGNMYGLTWTHTNIGTGANQSIAGLSHQLQLRENGLLKCAFGRGIWTAHNITSGGQGTLWGSSNDGSGSGLDADLLDGLQPSVNASNNTIVQRHSSGYIFANYFNTTANDVTSGVTSVMVETGNDNYIRHGKPSAIASFLDGITVSGATATRNGHVAYYYNPGSITPVRGDASFHVFHMWTSSPTITLTNSSFTAGDICSFHVMQAADTVTVNATRIYLPNGSYDNSITFTGPGSFSLFKYNTTAGYWMATP